jgi:rhodanese-related sulfurtransferase
MMTAQPKEISADLESGRSLTLIDVRTPSEYRSLHIPGSRSIPLDQLDASSVKSLEASDGRIVLVCHSGRRAEMACEKLVNSGLGNLTVLAGGVTAWEKAGLPVNRGKKAISLERQVRIAAGFLVLCGVVLGGVLHPYFYALSAFVGAGLVFAGITDTCGMAMFLSKMPWNRGGDSCSI